MAEYIGDTDFAPITGIDMGGNGYGMARFGNDSKVIMRFYMQSILHPAKSEQQGRPIFEDHEFISIQHPGERDVLNRKVKPEDIQRFPRQYHAFKLNKEQVVEGTPIDLLFPNHPSIAANLRGQNIHTVEMLANLSATGIAGIGTGGQDYVNVAQQYMEAATRGVDQIQMHRALSERDQQIKIQQQQIDQLKHQLDLVIKQQSAIPPQFQPQTPQMFQPAPVQYNTDLPPPPVKISKLTPKRSRPKV